MKRVTQHLINQRFETIYVNVQTSAKQFFEKCGFRLEEEREFISHVAGMTGITECTNTVLMCLEAVECPDDSSFSVQNMQKKRIQPIAPLVPPKTRDCIPLLATSKTAIK